MTKSYNVTILGSGAWGSALAAIMRQAGHAVRLLARDESLAHSLACGKNPARLAGIQLPLGIVATSDPAVALDPVDCILSAIPAQSFRNALERVSTLIPCHVPLVLCSKGIEQNTGMRLSQIAREFLPCNPLAVLSGPGFALDVARDLPTAVVVASEDLDLASELSARFSTPSFRCYANSDLPGVEIAGALKNVFAISAGAVIGANLGEGIRAAIIARGFIEMQRIAPLFEGKAETMLGLSGLGDLFLTCSSLQSRNFSYGVALARQEKLDSLPLAEGVPTAFVVDRIAREASLETPIVSSIVRVLNRSITIREAVSELMMRPLRVE